MRVINKLEKVLVPAGKYYLGDPCYSVPDDEWDSLLGSCNYFLDSAVGTCPNGLKVLSFGTAFGDGCYSDNTGRLFPVDAGMIGLTPVLEGWNRDDCGCGIEDGVYLVEFTQDTICSSDGKVLRFGGISIDTDPSEDDDENDY